MRQFFKAIWAFTEYSYGSEFAFPDFEVLFSKIQFANKNMFKMIILHHSVDLFSIVKSGTMFYILVKHLKLIYNLKIFNLNFSDLEFFFAWNRTFYNKWYLWLPKTFLIRSLECSKLSHISKSKNVAYLQEIEPI